MTVDTLIVADNSDLNVYKTASEANEVLGCCGPASKSASSCCGSKDEEKKVEKQKDIDLNEWAGKCSPSFIALCREKLTTVQAHTRYMPSNRRTERPDLSCSFELALRRAIIR